MIEEGNISEKEAKLSEEQTLYYTAAFIHPLSYTEGFNASINALSENLSFLGKVLISDGEEYLYYIKDHLDATEMGYKFEEIEDFLIGNKEFQVLKTQADYGVLIYQDYYSAILNGHAFTFILSYTDDEHKAKLMSVLDGVTFED